MPSVFTCTAPETTCQLTVTDLKGEHCFSSADIIRMKAANNYTILYFTRHRPFITSKVLKVYEEMLLPYGFLRIHRSHLVNLQRNADNQPFDPMLQMQAKTVARNAAEYSFIDCRKWSAPQYCRLQVEEQSGSEACVNITLLPAAANALINK